MNICSDEGDDHFPLDLSKIRRADQGSEALQLPHIVIKPVIQGHRVGFPGADLLADFSNALFWGSSSSSYILGGVRLVDRVHY